MYYFNETNPDKDTFYLQDISESEVTNLTELTSVELNIEDPNNYELVLNYDGTKYSYQYGEDYELVDAIHIMLVDYLTIYLEK